MNILSLGWGCQSFALAAMSAKGILPKLDCAIHADTYHERAETYDFAQRWTPWLEDQGIPVVVVHARPTDELFHAGHMPLPAFTTRLDGTPSGLMRRQCTDKWKIRPMRHWIQQHRDGAHVNMWLGITLDEIDRMRDSGLKYLTNTYPFLQLLDPRWTRADVITWLHDNDLEVPAKSNCVFCPFQNLAEWREIQTGHNGNWHQALHVDNAVRHSRDNYISYLIYSRQPLQQADFRTPEEKGQIPMWSEECSGICGV